jgi:hypothetical protein
VKDKDIKSGDEDITMAAQGLPVFPPYKVSSDGASWKKWFAKFENMLRALDVTTDARKKAMLLHYVGEETYDIYDSFTNEQKGVGAVDGDNRPNEYAVATKSLTDYFTPKKNTTYEVFKFRQATQNPGENIDSFCTRLRTLASTCEFHNAETEILSQILQGCTSSRLRRKSLKDGYNLKQVIDEARAIELSESRAAEMENRVSAVRHKQARRGGGFSGGSVTAANSSSQNDASGNNASHQDSGGRGQNLNRQNSAGARSSGGRSGTSSMHQKGFQRGGSSHHHGNKNICRNCGGYFPHTTLCPAKGKECRACRKVGHFAKVCRSKNSLRLTLHDCEDQDRPSEENDSSDDSDHADEHVVFTVGTSKTPTVTLHIDDRPLTFIVDTGATLNILDYSSYQSLCRKPKLLSPCPVIYAYGSQTPLPVVGYFAAEISHKKKTVSTNFYVIKHDADRTHSNLLSGHTAEKLHIIQFALSSSTKLSSIIDSYPTLFDGKDGKISDIVVKLHINELVQPVTQRHRRIPYHVRKDVEAELERLERLDIIEHTHGPTPWISPIVVVPKKEGVRVCIDMREANKAIKREKHPMPTIDDLISDLNGSVVFSKLDLTGAYHQLELDEASRYITTFTTHVGLRRYKRLLFGVNAASEIFQNAISQMLNDIPGVRNLSDDIIIFGKTQQDHDRSLKRTLQRLEERGAKLNKDKVQISVSELTFFGHVFSASGVKPDPKKIDTIVKSAAPTNVGELRSFLGMTQYVARFIPNYASRTEPLRKLTTKDATWRWTRKEQESFENIKEALTSTQVMAYFDPNKPTEVHVDASPVGLGAILTQNNRVISYASRALTDTEQRYSQTEREMLAVVFGVEHFHLYLFGSSFTMITDHKPLLGIIKSQKPATARIDRLRLRLMPYEMKLQYQPGRDDLNPADYLSRHPRRPTKHDNASEAYINYVTKNAVPKSMTLEEVQTATQRDKTMKKLMKAIETGKWTNDLTEFSRFKDELSVCKGVILRDHRLIIPEFLRKKVVEISHSSHQGIVKTKQFIREKVWFPGIDKMVEQTVKSCTPCQASIPTSPPREPLIMTDLPSGPWLEVAVDFAGPFPSGDYLLVVVDEYSRFPEVDVVSSTSARTVIPHLDSIFARHGIPAIVKTDNGPPFNGNEFREFADELGFHHRKITPLWPEANGEAERFMATLNKFVKTSQAENVNWKTQLSLFLRQYRATPHSSTKISPFEALTGRKMRSGLPEAPQTPHPHASLHSKMIHNDQISKQKMKTHADVKRHTVPSDLAPGDTVLVKQPKTNKLTPPFCPKPYTIMDKKGSMVTAKRGSHRIVRNSSYFRRIPTPASDVEEEEEEEEEEQTFTPCSQSVPAAQHQQSTSWSMSPQKTAPERRPQAPMTPASPIPMATSPARSAVQSSPVAQRPVRARKMPSYLKDYVTKSC